MKKSVSGEDDYCVRRDIHVVGARAHHHKHAYGETFTCKLAGPSPPKRYLLKASPPASTAVAVVTVARPHACAHVRVPPRTCVFTYTRVYRQKPHTLFVESRMRARCTRSHTSRKRNRVEGEARTRRRTTTTTTMRTRTRTMRHTYTSRYRYTMRCFTDEGWNNPLIAGAAPIANPNSPISPSPLAASCLDYEQLIFSLYPFRQLFSLSRDTEIPFSLSLFFSLSLALFLSFDISQSFSWSDPLSLFLSLALSLSFLSTTIQADSSRALSTFAISVCPYSLPSRSTSTLSFRYLFLCSSPSLSFLVHPSRLSASRSAPPGVCLFDAFSLSISLPRSYIFWLAGCRAYTSFTYRARPIPRAGFSLNRRQREPPDRSCHPTPPPRPSALLPLPPLVSSPLPQSRRSLHRSLRACVRTLPRVCVRACLTIRVFVSAMNALSLTVNRAARSAERK